MENASSFCVLVRKEWEGEEKSVGVEAACAVWL